jgi:hypothetical protein
VLAIRNRAVRGVDVGNQFGKVQRKLPVRLHRADVIRTDVVLAGRPRVVAVPPHHDQIVRPDEVGEIVAAVVRALVVIVARGGLVVALAPAVKKVHHGISFSGGLVIGRQENSVVACLMENLALVRTVEDNGSGTESAGGMARRVAQGGGQGRCWNSAPSHLPDRHALNAS